MLRLLQERYQNSLWFQTRNGTTRNWGRDYPLWYYDPTTPGTSRTFQPTTQQPLLVPVLQLHATNDNPTGTTVGTFPVGPNANLNTWWLAVGAQNSVAEVGTFNMILGTGDTPARPNEFNGGLQNLPRYLETYEAVYNANRNSKIFGSFLQIGRSRFATAPYQAMKNDAGTNAAQDSMFGNGNDAKLYRNGNSNGRTPFFNPPDRIWGFDVGLLSQTPDRYASKFAQAGATSEDYFREVSRNDPWVETLLCSKKDGGTIPALPRNGASVAQTGTDCTDYGG
ncbi:MAG: hypothetical protein HC920_15650 [Oscillatoriales cyanobacterium SM2_3_0]|nr:hypothetical protein [Oscillatoriales cyanobacterium SM2_3_0]